MKKWMIPGAVFFLLAACSPENDNAENVDTGENLEMNNADEEINEAPD
ncbi:hypothetical protein [Alkalicoccus chagannorensis]|nr:hypothetical protein [Alkalicoccus chagannorensis]